MEATKMTETKYAIRGYCGDTDGGYDDESCADTLKEAKQRARNMMSEEHMRVVESTVPVIYVEVVNMEIGEVVADFGTRI
jgi:hypothetical protein